MKAAVLFNTNQLEVVSGIEIPKLQNGQVLVQVAYSGVCHSQLMEVRGKRGEDRWLPHLLGHEGTGVIEDVGPGVTKVKKGDRVILGWLKGDGSNAAGAAYKWRGKTLNSGGVTTFSTHTVVSENRCYLMPNDIPMDVGVLFGCAIPTGAGIILNDLKPISGTTVAILGLGGIGFSALLAARTIDFSKIIAIDVSNRKLELAKKMGAITLNPNETNLRLAVKELTGGLGLNYCVEAAGLISTIELGFDLIKTNGGKLVFASHPPTGEKISIDPHALISGKEIKGSWGGGSSPDQDNQIFFDLYKKGVLDLSLIMDRQYLLEEVNQALSDLEEKKVGRPILAINPNL